MDSHLSVDARAFDAGENPQVGGQPLGFCDDMDQDYQSTFE